METPNITLGGRPNSQPQDLPPQRNRWLESLMRQATKAVLALGPQGAGPCRKHKCGLQPYCECTRGDFAAARSLESRLWLLLLACGVILLITAFAYGFKR